MKARKRKQEIRDSIRNLMTYESYDDSYVRELGRLALKEYRGELKSYEGKSKKQNYECCKSNKT